VGTLDLEAKPPATVEIDGQPAGSSPLAARELAVGRHVLKLSHPDYWPITRFVSVEPGRSLRLDLDLSWEAVPRARSREAPYVTPIEGSPSDPYFERGLKQMGAGDFQEAILTLEPVARRLQAAGKGKELARAEFYLAVALLELNRQASARERFLKALEHDDSLKAPAGFSPKVTSVFAAVRDTLKKKP
jgi:tetratricopeptide (TPR) repeat protein